MTRQECEKKLLDLMGEAYAIAQQYDPTINHVSLYSVDGNAYAMGSHDIGGGLYDTLLIDASRFADEGESA